MRVVLQPQAKCSSRRTTISTSSGCVLDQLFGLFIAIAPL